MTVDPVVSLVIGVAIFDEQFRNSPADLVGEAFGLALVVAAAMGLTRSVAGPTDEAPVPPEEHRATAMNCSPPSGSRVAAAAQVYKGGTKAITRSGE
jgi:hypothetical protein